MLKFGHFETWIWRNLRIKQERKRKCELGKQEKEMHENSKEVNQKKDVGEYERMEISPENSSRCGKIAICAPEEKTLVEEETLVQPDSTEKLSHFSMATPAKYREQEVEELGKIGNEEDDEETMQDDYFSGNTLQVA